MLSSYMKIVTDVFVPCKYYVTFYGRMKQEEYVLYFAYGSNLWREQMTSRCPEHREVGTGCLKGWRWIKYKLQHSHNLVLCRYNYLVFCKAIVSGEREVELQHTTQADFMQFVKAFDNLHKNGRVTT
jgi:hypothetical protein